jgi:DedD protein
MARGNGELFKDKIEVSLDGRQVFYLFFGGAVIASLVFVLGVMVGKRVEARAHVAPTATTSAALDPLAALDQLGREEQGEQLAFPAALSGDPEAAAAPLGTVDQAIAAESQGADSKGGDSKKADGKKAAKPAPAAAKPTPAPAKPTPAPAAEPNPAPAVGAAPAKVTADPVPSPDEGDSGAKKHSRYTLQLSSFQDRGEAQSFFDQLKASGYQPYIVEADVPGRGTWYRVRLGDYDTYGDALAAKKKFEDKQQIIAYVTKRKR